MESLRVEKAVIFVKEAILCKKLDVSNAFKLIEEIYRVVLDVNARSTLKITKEEIQATVVNVVKIIAAGVDGIAGTDDDIISVDVVQKINQLLSSDIVPSIIEFVSRIPQQEVIAKCVPLLCGLFKKVANR